MPRTGPYEVRQGSPIAGRLHRRCFWDSLLFTIVSSAFFVFGSAYPNSNPARPNAQRNTKAPWSRTDTVELLHGSVSEDAARGELGIP